MYAINKLVSKWALLPNGKRTSMSFTYLFHNVAFANGQVLSVTGKLFLRSKVKNMPFEQINLVILFVFLNSCKKYIRQFKHEV